MPSNKKVVRSQSTVFKRGFTLIEMLIVISIIAILFGAATYSYLDSQMKARDGKRKSDLATIQQALEQFKADNGSYPTNYKSSGQDYTYQNVLMSCTTGSNPSSGISWSSPFTCTINGSTKTYMATLPNDPINNGYVYKNYEWNYLNPSDGTYEFINAPPGWCQLDLVNSTPAGTTDPKNVVTAAVKNCSHYTLWTTLENKNDPDILKTLADPICKIAARFGGIGSRPDQITKLVNQPSLATVGNMVR